MTKAIVFFKKYYRLNPETGETELIEIPEVQILDENNQITAKITGDEENES